MNDVKDKQLKYERALEYEIFVKGEYGFAIEKIQNAKCIFDIWGHIWLFSQWSRILNSNVKIHYFEPIEEFYDKAKFRVWNDNNIILNNCWIGTKSESWIILLNNEKTMQSSKYSSFLNRNWSEVKVKFIPLKEYLILNDINKIDVLKMDIEWMEFEVLSWRWDFERERITNLIVEIHLLNQKMKSEWNQIFSKIKNVFWNVEVINTWYCDEIFLVWCYDNLISKIK